MAVTQVAVYPVPVRSFPSSCLSEGRCPRSCLSVGRWTRRSVSVGGTLPKKSSVAVCLGRYPRNCLSCASTELPKQQSVCGPSSKKLSVCGPLGKKKFVCGWYVTQEVVTLWCSSLFVSVGSCPSINFFFLVALHYILSAAYNRGIPDSPPPAPFDEKQCEVATARKTSIRAQTVCLLNSLHPLPLLFAFSLPVVYKDSDPVTRWDRLSLPSPQSFLSPPQFIGLHSPTLPFLLRHGRDVRPTWVRRCVPYVTLVSMRGLV